MARDRIPKAAGTYTMADILLRHPTRLLGPPRPYAGRMDREAVHRGECRQVACWLRGSFDPFPRTLTHGMLVIGQGRARWSPWSPFWSTQHPPTDFEFTICFVDTRTTTSGDGPLGRTPRTVVVCGSESRNVNMIVPPVDVPLVLDAFNGMLTDQS